MGFNNSFFYVFSKFSYSCNFAFSVLMQTFLSNEPSETLDSSTTFNFLMSVRISNFSFIVGFLSVFVVRGILLGSMKVFGSHFLGFVTYGM